MSYSCHPDGALDPIVDPVPNDPQPGPSTPRGGPTTRGSPHIRWGNTGAIVRLVYLARPRWCLCPDVMPSRGRVWSARPERLSIAGRGCCEMAIGL